MRNQLALFFAIIFFAAGCSDNIKMKQPQVESRVCSIIDIGGLKFRDLNRNGTIDPYEDWRNTPENRVADLLERMTLDEKVGQMFTYRVDHKTTQKPDVAGTKADNAGFGAISEAKHKQFDVLINDLKVGHLKDVPDLKTPADYADHAEWHNKVQEIAERQRLGIPVLYYNYHGLAEEPRMITLATTRDKDLVRRWGADFARRFRTIGVHESPIVLLCVSTEPRWIRVEQTFGEDADLCADLTVTAMEGIQGPVPNPNGLLFYAALYPGGGPQKDGFDPHFSKGRDMVYPGGMLDYHLKPWKAAIKYGLFKVMPYYGIVRAIDTVGAHYSKKTIDGLLRQRLGYTGCVGSDFDAQDRPWGLDDKGFYDRYDLMINSGVDQCNSNNNEKDALFKVVIVRQLVADGRISRERIDEAVGRLLINKFRLGLFEDPYTDPKAAEAAWSDPAVEKIRREVLEKSNVLLKNNGVLPLKSGANIAGDFSPRTTEELTAAGVKILPLSDWKKADVVFLNLHSTDSAWKIRSTLYYMDWDNECALLPELKKANKPVVVTVPLLRPYLLGPIVDQSDAIIAAPDNNVMARPLLGKVMFTGKMPITLPRNQKSVENQLEDVPFDLKDPLWPYGFGMTGKEPAEPRLEYRNEWVDENGVVNVEVRCADYDTFMLVPVKKGNAVIAQVPLGMKAGIWYNIRSDIETFSMDNVSGYKSPELKKQGEGSQKNVNLPGI